MKFHTGLLSLFLVAGTAMPAGAVDAAPHAITFAQDNNTVAIRGKVSGADTVFYSLDAEAGQTLIVRLSTDNSSNYFNIRREGAPSTLFTGSLEGGPAALKINENGVYLIDVYLMRNAARRGEQASFTLNVTVEN